MVKEAFVYKSFGQRSQGIITLCNAILGEYAAQGYDLSLRQLFYQMVSRDYLPNTVQAYKNLGDIVSDARLAGRIDWAMIDDRGRVTVSNTHWESPADILTAAAEGFMIDRWAPQPCYIECMVEKDALSGVLGPVCRGLDIRFTANRGYNSSTAMYKASKRMLAALAEDKEVHVLYLGDHDPSGLDMSRDIWDRLELFLGRTWARVQFEDEEQEKYALPKWAFDEPFEQFYNDGDWPFDVHRLALNWSQVEQYHPPENPTKTTDSRAKAYIHEYGTSSWELDALEPTVLAGLVTGMVETLRDEDVWQQTLAQEKTMRDALTAYAQEWKDKNGG